MAAIDLNIDDTCILISLVDAPLVCTDSKSSIDQECSSHVSLRSDDLLPWKSDWRDPWSIAWSSAESAEWMYVGEDSSDQGLVTDFGQTTGGNPEQCGDH